MMNIEFCEKCRSAMQPVKGGYRCRNCGFLLEKRSEGTITARSRKEETVVIEDNAPYLPKTEKECPKCSSPEAWFWVIQTRSSDEPPTQFFRCTKCRHVWREYK